METYIEFRGQNFEEVAQGLDRHTLLLIVASPNLPSEFEGVSKLESAYYLYWQEQSDKLTPHPYRTEGVSPQAEVISR